MWCVLAAAVGQAQGAGAGQVSAVAIVTGIVGIACLILGKNRWLK